MVEIDRDATSEIAALQEQIVQSTRGRFSPRASVTAQIHNAIGRRRVDLCVAEGALVRSTNRATGKLVLFAGPLVALVSLEAVPHAHASAREEWSIAVRMLPRSSLRSAELLSTHGGGDRLEPVEHSRLAWSTRLRLHYADTDPVEVGGPDGPELEPVLAVVLGDLEAS